MAAFRTPLLSFFFFFSTGPSHRAVGRREERGLKDGWYGVGAPKRSNEVARHAVVLKVFVENRIPNGIYESASAVLKVVIHAIVEEENSARSSTPVSC